MINLKNTSLVFFLWIYGGVLFFTSGFLSLTRDGHETIIKEIDIIIIVTLVMIEVINQITYYYSKRNKDFAAKIKCLMFWVLLSVSSIIYWHYLLKLQQEFKAPWHEILGVTLTILGFVFYFPFYSLDTSYRFIFLKDKFKGVS